MARITKEIMVNGLVEINKMTKADAKRIIDNAIQVIISEIEESSVGDIIQFSPLGSFKLMKSKEREGRNPKTGEAINIKSKVILKFIPSATIKRNIQEEK